MVPHSTRSQKYETSAVIITYITVMSANISKTWPNIFNFDIIYRAFFISTICLYQITDRKWAWSHFLGNEGLHETLWCVLVYI